MTELQVKKLVHSRTMRALFPILGALSNNFLEKLYIFRVIVQYNSNDCAKVHRSFLIKVLNEIIYASLTYYVKRQDQ